MTLYARVKTRLSRDIRNNKMMTLSALWVTHDANCADRFRTLYVIYKERCSYTLHAEGYTYISAESYMFLAINVW